MYGAAPAGFYDPSMGPPPAGYPAGPAPGMDDPSVGPPQGGAHCGTRVF